MVLLSSSTGCQRSSFLGQYINVFRRSECDSYVHLMNNISTFSELLPNISWRSEYHSRAYHKNILLQCFTNFFMTSARDRPGKCHSFAHLQDILLWHFLDYFYDILCLLLVPFSMISYFLFKKWNYHLYLPSK